VAELTNLESKLGEVLGLAMAAQGATDEVKKLDDLDDDLAKASGTSSRSGRVP
jgi:hypothetical protein